jgi:hypothetical protein
MERRLLTVLGVLVLLASEQSQQSRAVSMTLQPASLDIVNTEAKSGQYKGKSALQLASPPGKDRSDEDMLAILKGTNFKNGTITVEFAGAPRADATPDMRGFIGIAFRVQGDGEKFECFYLRPSNGRSDDQLRRNHSLQYISSPDYGWSDCARRTLASTNPLRAL